MKTSVSWLGQKIPAILSSRKFLVATLVLFALQSLLLAVVMPTSHPITHSDGSQARSAGLVPDGHRHMGAIYYYAEQPLLSGPFIDDMADGDLWMGDLIRFPSYFYQYLMSFPTRALLAIGASDAVIVMTIRLLGILLGLAALLVFRKIALEIKAGKAIANLATLSLALTGSFAYLSPAENYDIMALLLFFMFTLASLRLFTRRNWLYLYWMLVVFLFLGITKYTYIPFAGLIGLAAVWLGVKQDGLARAKRLAIDQWKTSLASLKKWQLIGLTILLLIGSGLFVERIGVNLAVYQSFNPDCTNMHSHEACMRFGVYARNYNRLEAVGAQPAGSYDFKPLSYAGEWIGRYYSSMYLDLAHIWIYDVTRIYVFTGVASLIVTAAVLGYAKLKRIRLLRESSQWLVLGAAGLMIVTQVAFNLNIVFKYHGSLYAHQGRYLMASAGFLYIILLIALVAALRAYSGKRRAQVKLALAVFGALTLLAMSPILSYWLHAWSAEWYSPLVRDLLPSWWFDFREFIFYHVIGKVE